MKTNLFIICLIPVIFSCTQRNDKKPSGGSVKKEVMDVAIKYVNDKVKEPKQTVSSDGIVTIVDNQVSLVTPAAYQMRYVIDPGKIITGRIDDDTNDDAIVYIADINGQDLETPENLILIKTDGKFILSRVIETNMKVLGIKDGIITAEVSTRSLNSPLRDCNECKEVVKYRFKSGDLIRVE